MNMKEDFRARAKDFPRWSSFDPSVITPSLVKELTHAFGKWASPRGTGLAVLPPIARAVIELDGDGGTTAALFDKAGDCFVGDAMGVDLEALGLAEMAEDDPTLAAMALGVALTSAVPQAAQGAAFRALPRCSTLEFAVGVHGTWGDALAFVLECDAYQPSPPANPRLAQLRLEASPTAWSDDPPRAAAAYAALQKIDVTARAREWASVLQQSVEFFAAQSLPPLQAIALAWSPDAARAPVIGAVLSRREPVPSPVPIDLSWWLPLPSVSELGNEFAHVRLRYETELKFGEIACVAMETVAGLSAFQKLRKRSGFSMYTRNRDGGAPARFYPLTS